MMWCVVLLSIPLNSWGANDRLCYPSQESCEAKIEYVKEEFMEWLETRPEGEQWELQCIQAEV